jgi:hypothetical protein
MKRKFLFNHTDEYVLRAYCDLIGIRRGNSWIHISPVTKILSMSKQSRDECHREGVKKAALQFHQDIHHRAVRDICVWHFYLFSGGSRTLCAYLFERLIIQTWRLTHGVCHVWKINGMCMKMCISLIYGVDARTILREAKTKCFGKSTRQNNYQNLTSRQCGAHPTHFSTHSA